MLSLAQLKKSSNFAPDFNLRICALACAKARANRDNIGSVEFSIHDAKEDIVRSIYDYQLVRGWPSVAKHTGIIVGYDESAIRKFIRRKH